MRQAVRDSAAPQLFDSFKLKPRFDPLGGPYSSSCKFSSASAASWSYLACMRDTSLDEQDASTELIIPFGQLTERGPLSTSSSETENNDKAKDLINPKLDFFAGTVAGVASLLTGHPFDTIKVRLQTDQGSISASLAPAKRYRNALHAFTCTVQEEKLRGLYKGVMSPMLGVAAVNASVFGFYGMAMRLQLSDPKNSPTLTQITVAGSVSGIATSFLTTPIERLKILQQSAPSNLHEPSLYSLVKKHSLRSLYRGFVATVLRDIAYGPYFLTYEAICRADYGIFGGSKGVIFRSNLVDEVEAESREVGWARLLVAGGAAGIVGWGSTFAMDVVKTRIQSSEPYLEVSSSHTNTQRANFSTWSDPASRTPAPHDFSSRSGPAPNMIESSGLRAAAPSQTSKHTSSKNATNKIPHPYRTIWSTIMHSYRTEGIRVFSAGLGPTLLRAVPVNMVCFFVFEAVVGALR